MSQRRHPHDPVRCAHRGPGCPDHGEDRGDPRADRPGRDAPGAAGALPCGRGTRGRGGGPRPLPRPVLRELLAAVPATYTIAGAGGLRHVVGDDAAPAACQAIVTDPWIIDYETGEPRRPRARRSAPAHGHRPGAAHGGRHQPDGLPAGRCARAHLQPASHGGMGAGPRQALLQHGHRHGPLPPLPGAGRNPVRRPRSRRRGR